MKPCFPWVGGKGKLLWLIHKLFPSLCSCFVDVFGGSGTVLLSRPLKKGCAEIYNDYNSNLTNLFYCIKNRPLALLLELAFLPLNSRDGFNVLLKFFKKEEFTDEYLEENLELAKIHLKPPEYEQLRDLLLERAALGDVTRAANYYKLIRYSYNSNTTAFAGRACDIRQFFHLIWDCSRRFAKVVVENKDFQSLIRQYDGDGVAFYCDPPYYQAEDCYAVEFSMQDHARLHGVLRNCRGFVMVSYNNCRFIRKLYQDFYIYSTDRPNSMSHKPGSRYEELIITNYDSEKHRGAAQMSLFETETAETPERKYRLIHKPQVELWAVNQTKNRRNTL